MKKISFFVYPLIFLTFKLTAQLVTTNTMTPTQLVNQVLLGVGVTASNISFTGDVKQRTKFNATASTSLGIPSGVFLSTGNGLSSSANGPQGPNNSGSTSTSYFTPGDPLLDIASGNPTFDAAILEFDFIPMGDSLKFRYCFASEEYIEYVNGGVNDVFGFFLSGPNPAGGVYTNHNIALVPGTTTPVSIDNVNHLVNTTYFRHNNTNSINIEFDGLTKVLYALEKVVCGQSYHIKIAIADGGDESLDSGVFLEGGSFSSSPPISVSSLNSNASISDTMLVEDCNSNCVYFIRGGNKAQKDSFMLQVTGNATLGSDYTQQGNTSFIWPNKLIFSPNQDTLRFCNLKALEDNLPEGIDTLVFTISSYTNTAAICAITGSISFKLYIRDYTAMNVTQSDSIICNGQSIVLNAGPTFGFPPYTYSWSPSAATTQTYATGSLTQPATYSVRVNDFCNKPVSKQITVTPTTTPSLTSIPSYTFCLDSTRLVPVTVSGGKAPLDTDLLIPASGFAPTSTSGTGYTFVQSGTTPSSGTYTISVTDACNITDITTFNLTTIDCRIVVPNVVTSNGDNVNDYFRIRGLENFTGSALSVYNRWGTKVFSSEDYRNDWKPDMSSGTYYYVLDVEDGRTFNGFLELFHN